VRQDSAAWVAEQVLARSPRLGRVRLVCVDGPAGSGKTSFAGRLVEQLDAGAVRVGLVHLDDLYDGWSGLEGSLWPRLASQVLEPLRRELPGRYQRYDWPSAAFADWVDVPVPDVLVLEGCGAARRAAAPDAVLSVWVEAPAELRLARGLARDGEALRGEWVAWTATESAHFERERTRERADVRLDAYGRMTA
jgi:uridine kinase